jgi:hypothetical protein
LAPNDFWLFAKVNSALKGRRLHDIENITPQNGDGTESCSITGVPKMFPAVAA